MENFFFKVVFFFICQNLCLMLLSQEDTVTLDAVVMEEISQQFAFIS